MIKLAVLFMMLQLTFYDCFPSSVYMALRNMGARIKYEEVVELATKDGIGYSADSSFVSEFGFSGYYTYTYNYKDLIYGELLNDEYPVLCLNLQNSVLGHCVMVYGIDEHVVYIVDPKFGYSEIPHTEMGKYLYEYGWFIVTFDAPIISQSRQYWGK